MFISRRESSRREESAPRVKRAPPTATVSAALALWLLAGWGAASADPQGQTTTATQPDQYYRVHVCNNSGKTAVVAAVYQPVGDDNVWKHQGWWRMAPGECVYVFNTDNPSFAMRAESLDDAAYWGTTGFQQCFQTQGPYEFMMPLNVTTCTAPATSRPAVQFTATAKGDFTWTIAPQ